MNRLAVDIIGWIGSFSVVIAYALVSYDRLKSTSVLYQFLNAFGSVCLIINTYYNTAYPSTFVNVVWLVIAISALIKSKNNSGK